MKLSKLLLAMAFVPMAMSCMNDGDMYEDCFRPDWHSSLSSIVTQNKGLFSKSGIVLSDYEEIESSALTVRSFINSESRYPVLTGDKITLAPYEFMEFDTLLCHVRSSHIDNMVKYALSNREEMITVRLSWQVEGEDISTIALFDKYSGDLVYDNIIYNCMLATGTNVNGLRPFKLTRSEVNNWQYYNGQNMGFVTYYETDSISHSVNGEWIKTIKMDCWEHGHWTLQINDYMGNDFYLFSYNFVHDSFDVSWDVSSSQNPGAHPENYVQQYQAIKNLTVVNGYKLNYFFYIGIENYPYTSGDTVLEINKGSNGHGAIRIIEKYPFRNSDLVERRQFDSDPNYQYPFP